MFKVIRPTNLSPSNVYADTVSRKQCFPQINSLVLSTKYNKCFVTRSATSCKRLELGQSIMEQRVLTSVQVEQLVAYFAFLTLGVSSVNLVYGYELHFMEQWSMCMRHIC